MPREIHSKKQAQIRGTIHQKSVIISDLASQSEFEKTYHLGIIDYLQEYNLQKMTELKMKSLFVKNEEAKTISVSTPRFY